MVAQSTLIVKAHKGLRNDKIISKLDKEMESLEGVKLLRKEAENE